jgi:hypothetical protein
LTTPILGSIVQKENWRFALCIDKQLNNVDFPTFGNPTIPAFMIVLFIKRLIALSLIFKFKSVQI